MPYKPSLIQKKWQVLTRSYVNYNGSAVVVTEIEAKSPCQNPTAPCPQYSSIINGSNAWTVYKETLSFLEVKAAVRELLYDVGLKKADIQVVELVNHDYIITPLN